MESFELISSILLSCFILANIVAHAQDQSAFISIDCGITDGSSYNDETTDIKYVSDATFIDSGISKRIAPELQTSTLEKQFYNVRSFPGGTKNCYDIQPPKGKGFKYLIRTRFMYGNYDGLGKAPDFDLYLGVNLWDSIILDNSTTIVTKEMIHTLQSDHIYVCLVDKGQGTPFLSVLELRLLKNDTYVSPYSGLMLYRRWDLGSISNLPVRYKDDVYDRIWRPLNFPNRRILNTSLTVDSTNNNNNFQPARIIMSTATSPQNLSQPPIDLYWEPEDPSSKFYVFMHFAEVEELQANQTREFYIFQNDTKIYDAFRPLYLSTITIYTETPVSGSGIDFLLIPTNRSTLPPLINAIETYQVNELLQSPTDQQDANAIKEIKSNYRLKKNWQGDPCAPVGYSWEGLNCSYNDNNPPRIVSVNLSFNGLTGQIDRSFANLTSLQTLDLSNNNLTGTVPAFLADLPDLTDLNLEENKLRGSLPVKLLERSKNGSLSLRVGGNAGLCLSASCQKTKKKNGYVIPLVASLVALLVLSTALTLLWHFTKRRQAGGTGFKTGPLGTTNRYYKHSEIVKVTNNFERTLGQGGFGTVYHGLLEGTQVAVKMLSPSSTQGYKEFHAEVELLMRVHHRNLTSLIGYCNEGTHMALIYEYMAKGNLGDYLSGKKSYILSWEERLQILLDAAQGLEYLHYGCKPPIVHRDVKPANILLNAKLQAKIADFGLSRSFPMEGTSHVSTVVAGTIGYLDPEYHGTNHSNEKSDVYSFGVVLLEVITGQPVIVRSRAECSHISDRVSFMLVEGDIRSITDPRLGEHFDSSSAWKIVEIALACASKNSVERPTMSQVVTELKECVAKANARRNQGNGGANLRESTVLMSMNLDSDMAPQAR